MFYSGNIGAEIRNTFEDLLISVGNDVELHWKEPVDVPVNFNRNNESTYPTESVSRSMVIRGLVHYINYGSTGQQRYANLVDGDVMLDISLSVDLDGKESIGFKIDGQMFSQKLVGRDLAKAVDSFSCNVGSCRTLALSLSK